MFNGRHRRGFTLLSVVVVAAIIAMLTLAISRMLAFQSKATRKLASSSALTDLSSGLSMLFEGPRCQTLRADALAINPSSVPYSIGGADASVVVGGACTTPAGYCLNLDTIRFPSGATAFSSLSSSETAQTIAPYSVQGLTFEALGGSTAGQYPFKMTITFAGHPPPRPLVKFVTIYTDPSNKVVGSCGAAASGPSAAGSLCGSVFWQTDGPGGTPCGNVQSFATCNGSTLMTGASCGIGVCPSGYTFTPIAYSWVKSGGVVSYYHQASCAKN